MFVRKNGILYNLNIYAKVFPDKERLALCLADVQGDFDTIDFKSQEELNDAFNLIIKFFKQSDRKKNKEADNILDLDESQDVFSDEKVKPNEEVLRELNPWGDPLEVNPDIPPVGVSREEWEESRRNNQNSWRDLYGENISLDNTQSINGVHTFSNAQIDSRVTFSQPMRDAIVDTLSESNNIINSRLSTLEEEHNNMLEELRVRNNMLQEQVESLRSIVNTLVEQRDNIDDDIGYGPDSTTWDF